MNQAHSLPLRSSEEDDTTLATARRAGTARARSRDAASPSESGGGAPRRTGAIPKRPRSRAAGGSALPVAALVLLVVAIGLYYRDTIPITPESGVGYFLGIAGGSTVLLLTLYAARKKLRVMRRWGKLSQWFRVHMMLGVLAPLLILFHCNFRLGAPNSNVALGSMLLVATSGVIGRFLYTRVNHGLYGARATRKELHQQLDLSAHTLGELLPPTSQASLRLVAFASRTQERRGGIAASLFRFTMLPVAARRVRRRVLADLDAELDREAQRSGWSPEARAQHPRVIGEMLARYLVALVRETQFGAYERIASLWHAIHVPLFVMLLLSGILHVIAVHMY